METKYPTFVEGGFVNEEEYLSCEMKILVLLKEVNSDDSGWSLPQLIRDQIHEHQISNVFDRIGLFCVAFKHGFKPFLEIEKIANHMNQSELHSALMSMAITNIKKTCGSSISNGNEILSYANNDKDLLEKEIQMLDPKIILCGGTFHTFQEAFHFDVRTVGTGANYGIYNNCLIIDLPHPAVRISKNVYYTYFKETLSEIEKLELLLFK